jgi:hypothetical protein
VHCLVDRCLSFCPFSFAIVLSVLLQFTDFLYLQTLLTPLSYILTNYAFDSYFITNNGISQTYTIYRRENGCRYNVWNNRRVWTLSKENIFSVVSDAVYDVIPHSPIVFHFSNTRTQVLLLLFLNLIVNTILTVQFRTFNYEQYYLKVLLNNFLNLKPYLKMCICVLTSRSLPYVSLVYILVQF